MVISRNRPQITYLAILACCLMTTIKTDSDVLALNKIGEAEYHDQFIRFMRNGDNSMIVLTFLHFGGSAAAKLSATQKQPEDGGAGTVRVTLKISPEAYAVFVMIGPVGELEELIPKLIKNSADGKSSFEHFTKTMEENTNWNYATAISPEITSEQGAPTSGGPEITYQFTKGVEVKKIEVVLNKLQVKIFANADGDRDQVPVVLKDAEMVKKINPTDTDFSKWETPTETLTAQEIDSMIAGGKKHADGASSPDQTPKGDQDGTDTDWYKDWKFMVPVCIAGAFLLFGLPTAVFMWNQNRRNKTIRRGRVSAIE